MKKKEKTPPVESEENSTPEQPQEAIFEEKMTPEETYIAENSQEKGIKEVQDRINANAHIITRIVDNIVKSYCSDLDTFMNKVKIALNSNTPLTDSELDALTLKIPVLLYFAGDGAENVGIKEDIAKSVKQELYNQIHDTTEGNASVKKIAAELSTQAEALNHIIFQRAYKKIKSRVDYALEMLQSVKKVISRRMGELELSNSAGRH
jgi:hypothetical protein